MDLAVIKLFSFIIGIAFNTLASLGGVSIKLLDLISLESHPSTTFTIIVEGIITNPPRTNHCHALASRQRLPETAKRFST